MKAIAFLALGAAWVPGALRGQASTTLTDSLVHAFHAEWNDNEVHLNGTSYGTRVAQVYMRRHPGSVRTVTLNSVAPVFEHGYVHMARSLQTSLDAVLEACEEDAGCDRANPDLRGRLDRVLTRLERTAWLAGSGDASAGYHFSALCAEDIAPLTDEEVARLSAGTFMGDHLIEDYREAFRLWDVADLPGSFWEPVRSDLPVLVISGEWDPVTPPAWGEAVAGYLPNSLHVVVPGGGHGPSNECTDRLEAELVETVSVGGLDPSCVGGGASGGSP